MFLKLNHQKLEVYSIARQFTLECYKATKLFPPDERFNLIQQIRRAALSVHLNLAEGASRKSETERKRFYEISRSSLIEVDAAFDIGSDLEYCSKENLEKLGETMIKSFKYLTGLINSQKK